MKRSELAVALAKDVLKRLRYLRGLGRGGYFSIDLENCTFQSGSLQKQMPDLEKHCGVCALGAVFLSFIRLKNRVKLEDCQIYDDSADLWKDDIVQRLRGAFSEKQLDLIEAAFECSTILVSSTRQFDDDVKDARDFGVRYSGDDRKRLRAIMLNIVKNEDKCPSCTAGGHTSPWEVSGCEACNNEYYEKLGVLQEKLGLKKTRIPMYPRRFKQTDDDGEISFGCYFPTTGVSIWDSDDITSGKLEDVEWIDI